jgi:hypothetical protein
VGQALRTVGSEIQSMASLRPAELGPITGFVYDHWMSIRPSPDRLPSRRDFDPLDLRGSAAAVLRHLWLLDVERDPWRFRYRLVGGAIADAGGIAKVGEYVDQFDQDGEFSARLRTVCETGLPNFRRGSPRLFHDRYIRELEVLVLPLATDGVTVDVLLNTTVYYWQSGFGPAGRTAP